MRHTKSAVFLILAFGQGTFTSGCSDDSGATYPSGSGGAGSGGHAGATTSGAGGGGAGTGGAGTGGGGAGGTLDGGAYRPSLLIDLGDACNTPDGMRKDPKSTDIILSCPNFFGKTGDAGMFSAPPALMKITADNKLEPYFSDLPVPPNAPGRAGPMGIDFGPDGNLYVCDHQYRYDTNYKSRVLRVNVDAMGKPTSADVVVDGIRLSNGLMWNKDYLYVTDTWAFDDPPAGGKSAIYRFSRTELAAANTNNPIHIQKPTSGAADGGAEGGATDAAPSDGGTVDPHMFAQLSTVAGRGVNLAGADGITFDDQGNLYTGNFGDGIITKITFDAQGNKASQSIFVQDASLTCADGIFFDVTSKNIYAADSQRNAIKVISPAGAVTTLWENADTTGEAGLLDQPAEPTIRGNDLIIANFDAGFSAMQIMDNNAKNTAPDAPHTISVIKLR